MPEGWYQAPKSVIYLIAIPKSVSQSGMSILLHMVLCWNRTRRTHTAALRYWLSDP